MCDCIYTADELWILPGWEPQESQPEAYLLVSSLIN